MSDHDAILAEYERLELLRRARHIAELAQELEDWEDTPRGVAALATLKRLLPKEGA